MPQLSYELQDTNYTLSPPRSLKLHRYDAKTVPESFKGLRCEALGHDVGILLAGRHMEDAELAGLHPFPNEVDVEFDVLLSLVMDRIRGHVDSRDVVTERHRSFEYGGVKLAEELSQPYAFGCGISDSAVLCLGAQPRHRGLLLGRP